MRHSISLNSELLYGICVFAGDILPGVSEIWTIGATEPGKREELQSGAVFPQAMVQNTERCGIGTYRVLGYPETMVTDVIQHGTLPHKERYGDVQMENYIPILM